MIDRLIDSMYYMLFNANVKYVHPIKLYKCDMHLYVTE